MAAGLGFKDFATGEVLTAADVDGYLMQGIWVFANATARDASVTSPQEGNFAFTKDNNSLWYYDGAAWVASGATGDIEGVTAGIGISGGGTSGTVTVTNSMATAIDAKGDLVAGTGADTFAKLTVGANGTILTADSAEATGLKWAAASGGGGGMTLLSTTSLSGSSVTVSSISSAYTDLRIIIRDQYNSTSDDCFFRLNGDTGSNYNHRETNTIITSSSGSGTLSCSSVESMDKMPVIGKNANSAVNQRGYVIIDIPRYTESEAKMSISEGYYTAGSTPNRSWRAVFGIYTGTSAINSFTYFPDTGTFSAGTIYIYGVK